MPAILMIEDNRDSLEALAEALAVMGYETITAVSGEEAPQLLNQRDDV
jgi:CheY-like chemotaxis protein